MITERSSPVCRAFLLRQGGDALEFATHGYNDVLECTTYKSLDQPAGTFSITLAPRRNWLNEVFPNDWVEIWMTDGRGPFELAMLGSVDRVERSRQTGANGDVTTRVTVSGRDWGKVLVKSATYFESGQETVENFVKMGELYLKLNSDLKVLSSPGRIVLGLLDIFQTTPDARQFVYPATNRIFYEVISKALIDVNADIGFMLFGDQPPHHPDLWSMMNQYSHRMMNLFYADTMPRYAAVIQKKEPTEKPNAPSTNLKLGDQGTTVTYAQSLLRGAGAYHDFPNGKFDANMRRSVSFYQTERRLRRTGEVDAATWTSLRNEGSTRAPDTGRGVGIALEPREEYLAAIVLKRLPYSQSDFNDLPTFEVTAEEIGSDQLGRSDHETLNWFRVIPEVLGGAPLPGIDAIQTVERLVLANFKSIERTGICRYEPTTPFANPIPDSVNIGADYFSLIREYNNILAVWHNENDLLLSGSVEVRRLRPQARVGYRCRITDTFSGETLECFTESVAHHFSYPGPSTTHLTLARGRNPETWPAMAKTRFDELGITSTYDVDKLIARGVVPASWRPGAVIQEGGGGVASPVSPQAFTRIKE